MTLALMLVAAMGYGQVPELLARYAMDETSGTNVPDVSGNGNDATLNECNDCWVEGTLEGALQFSGTTAVTLPAADMGLTSNEGSVAFWMKVAEPPTSIYTMFWAGDNETGGGFGAENEMHIHLEKEEPGIWNGGECSFFVIADPNTFIHSDPEKGGNPGVPPVNPILLGDNEWHHIAATWGGGFVALYIDGAVMWDTTAYNPTGYALDHIYLGQMANASRTYVGMMDDVRIYEGILSSFDVEDLYNKNHTRVDQLPADEAGLSVFPNPAGENASIRFSSEGAKNVSVNLYSVSGALIGNLHSGTSAAGENVIRLNTMDYSPGLYFVELQIGNKISYEKLVLK